MKMLVGVAGVAGLLAVVANLVILAGSLWVGGSLITSGIKASTDKCGENWPIEKVVSGNWFCQEG